MPQNLAPIDEAADVPSRQAVDGKVTNGGGLATATVLTQAAYDALATKDANTLYVIVG